MSREDTIKQVKEKLRIQNNQRVPCPIHKGKKNNFMFFDSGVGYCHSRCGKVALKKICESLDIVGSLVSGITKQQFIDMSSFDKKIIDARGIVDAENKQNKQNKTPRIVIPYYDENNEHYKDRYRDSVDGSDGNKFSWNFNKKDNKPLIPYNLNNWKDNEPFGVIVSGETDVIALEHMGIKNSLGFAGDKQFKQSLHMKLIEQIKTLLIWYENDSSSKDFLRQISIARPDAKVLFHDDYKDPSELWKHNDSFEESDAVIKEIVANAPNIIEFLENENEDIRKEFLDEDIKEIYPDIFRYLKLELSKAYAGNINPVLAVVIATASRGMDKPVHLYLNAPSSSGKTATVNLVIKCFYDDEFIKVVAGSPMSYFAREETYQDKVLFMAEIDSVPKGDNPIASAVREGTSGGHLTYDTTTDAQFGDRPHKHYDKGGNFSLIVTGTDYTLEKQINNRMLTYEIPHDYAQINKVAEFHAQKFKGNKLPDPDFTTIKKINKLIGLTPTKFKIPFIGDLLKNIHQSLTKQERWTRDSEALFNLICSVARIRLAGVERIEPVITCTLDDYEIAREVFGESIITASTNLTPAQRDLYIAIEELTKDVPKTTYKELEKHMIKTRQTLVPHMKKLVLQDLVSEDKTNKEYEFEIKQELPDKIGLPTVDTLRRLENEPTDRQITPEPTEEVETVEVSDSSTVAIEEPVLSMSDDAIKRQQELWEERYNSEKIWKEENW